MSAATPFERAERYLLGTISETLSPRTSYKLDRMRALLRELGDPHRAYPVVHVGGTSGKGSTASMIAAALQASGRRTALHTKPHLHSMTERAKIDGTAVSEDRFAELLDGMMPAIDRVTAAYGRPTYYETLLALAFSHFARERVDVAAIEVGLGGRLDGTNVVAPAVAAITSVGYDHTDVLGATLEAIATEKAGIAKPGVPLVVADVPPEAMAAIERYAAGAGARLVRAGDVASVERASDEAEGQRFEIRTPRATYSIRTPLLGAFQRVNAATAVAVLEALPESLRPPVDAVEAGFARLSIPGRLEVVAARPAVVLDIAHNVEKGRHLVAALDERFGTARRHFVVAIGESKDAREILRALASPGATFRFTAFEQPGRNAIAPAQLSELGKELGIEGSAVAAPAAALEAALASASAGDVVVVTGSTFVVAEVRTWYATTAAR